MFPPEIFIHHYQGVALPWQGRMCSATVSGWYVEKYRAHKWQKNTIKLINTFHFCVVVVLLVLICTNWSYLKSYWFYLTCPVKHVRPTKMSLSEAYQRSRVDTCYTKTDKFALGGKKKSFSSLSPGLRVLTACSQHITHCVLGQKSGNDVSTAQTNG